MIKKSKKQQKITLKHLIKHETKRYTLLNFIMLFVVLIGYFAFIVLKYGLEKGIVITLLTWSFFVLCTPVAAAGFLLDFPLRLTMKWRMFYNEVGVWAFAILINIIAFIFRPDLYDTFFLLKIFKYILTNPFPYWSIIILSGIGTFFSIHFADELMDVIKHKERKKYHKHMIWHNLVIFAFIITAIIFLYAFATKSIGLSLGVLLSL